MAINWTKEKIAELTVQEVSALQQNARTRGSLEIVNLCEEVLSKKKPIRKTRTSSTTKTLEAECSHQLSEVAKVLANKYDLSAKTATSKSVGIKGFRPHNLTSKDGQAKLGGEQRTGKAAIDRYISYRVKNEFASFGAWLVTKDEVEKLVWQVFGDKNYFPNFKSIKEMRPNHSNPDSSDEIGGEEFVDFSKASEKFEEIISKLALQKNEA